MDDIADFEDPDTIDDPAALALDRTLTARAFRSLPDRWQSVLWYTEVEGMDPHEVAPILGMTANGVAALSYRAREGLRKAWLQAHINDASASGECQWAISRIGDHARSGLSQRDNDRMTFHLATCAKCSIINEEVDEVGSRLALVMLPIMLGGVAGGAMLATFGHAGGAMAAGAVSAAAIPAVPAAIGGASTAAGSAATGVGIFGASTAPVALVGSLAIAVALGGGVVAITAQDGTTTENATSTTSTTESATDGVQNESIIGGKGTEGTLPPTVVLPPTDPTYDPIDPSDPSDLDHKPGVVDELVGGTVTEVITEVDTVVDSVVDTVTDDDGQVATLELTLTGTGTPGAHVALQALGQVYATTTVDANGNYTISATAIPGGLSSLDLVQTVDREYLKGIVGGGLLGTLLGTVDKLVDGLIKPLGLSGNSGGIAINVVG